MTLVSGSVNKDAGNGNGKFDQIVDNLSYPFAQGGHALAIKMGLASAGNTNGYR